MKDVNLIILAGGDSRRMKFPKEFLKIDGEYLICLLYTSPSPRDRQKSRMPSSA